MSPRQRRLLSDLSEMQELAHDGEVTFRSEGDPPTTYHLMLSCPGLAEADGGGLTVRNLHRCDIYLHLDYPRRPPVVVWLTPVFHPNLLGPERNGGVCIGGWSAAESLADLCRRLLALVSYRSLNAEDGLNRDASIWAREHEVVAGVPLERLAELPVQRHATIGRSG